MTLQKVLSRVRQAVEDYHMIEEGDRIAVGISGGKDSLTLLLALNELRKFYPQKFSIYAVTVDLGFQNLDLNEIRALCASHEIPYTVVETSIAKIVFEDRRENNPCSLCAKMRKGALNDAIKDLGCNKIAYAHHEDDVVETMMLSLFYEGRLYAGSRGHRLREQISGSRGQKSLSRRRTYQAGIHQRIITTDSSGKSRCQGSYFHRDPTRKYGRLVRLLWQSLTKKIITMNRIKTIS